jgi:hypothetical protein
LLIITEGVLDIACLTCFSQIVHAVHPEFPDLQQLTSQGSVVFLPAGGGDLAAWTTRLAPLGCFQVFLFDREQQPETDLRQRIVDQINERSGCRAALTRKRSLENYLHPTAIAATFGVTIEMTDEVPVAELVSRALDPSSNWTSLSQRQQQRLIYRAKRRLNLETSQHMTAELLAERDPTGEVVGWFRTIASLLP